MSDVVIPAWMLEEEDPTLTPSINPQLGSSSPVTIPETSARGVIIPPEFNEDIKPQPQKLAPVSTKEKTTFDNFTDFFTGNDRATEETEDLPESGDIKLHFSSGLPVALGRLTSFSEEGQKNVLKKHIPGIKFRKDSKGNSIVIVPSQGEFVLNKPGASPADIRQTAFTMASFIPATRIANFVSSLGAKTFGKTVVANATGAVATEGATGLTSQAMGSEEEITGERLALAGATELGGDLTGKVLKKGYETVKKTPFGQEVGKNVRALKYAITPEKTKAKNIGVDLDYLQQGRANLDESEKLTKETGIRFSQAQGTESPSSLAEQASLIREKGSDLKAKSFLENQNLESEKAVDTLKDMLSTQKESGKASSQIRNIANEEIQNLKDIRTKAAEPLYEEARAVQGDYSVKETKKLIQKQMKGFADNADFKKTLNHVNQLLKKQAGSEKLQFDQLDNAQKEISDMIRKAQTKGESNKVRLLTPINVQLKEEMDSINPVYKKAREAWELHTPAIEEMQDSTVGRIATLKNDQLRKAASLLFDNTEEHVNPDMVKYTRDVIAKKHPKEYNAIIRTFFEMKLGKMKVPEGNQSIRNIPGEIHRKLFPNRDSINVLKTAVHPETSKNIIWLERALLKASQGRTVGSPTDTFQAIRERRMGNLGKMRKVALFFRSPIQSMTDSGIEKEMDNVAKAAAEVIFNPEYRSEMARLRKLNPESPKADSLFLKMLNSAKDELPKPGLQAGQRETQNIKE